MRLAPSQVASLITGISTSEGYNRHIFVLCNKHIITISTIIGIERSIMVNGLRLRTKLLIPCAKPMLMPISVDIAIDIIRCLSVVHISVYVPPAVSSLRKAFSISYAGNASASPFIYPLFVLAAY